MNLQERKAQFEQAVKTLDRAIITEGIDAIKTLVELEVPKKVVDDEIESVLKELRKLKRRKEARDIIIAYLENL
jgi:adenosylcobinamide amidohydrolase